MLRGRAAKIRAASGAGRGRGLQRAQAAADRAPAGVAAITSAIAALRGYEVGLAIALIAIITVANLRSAKESGRLFAPPTYLYIAIMTLLVIWGLFQTFTGDLQPLPVDEKELAQFTGGEAML